MFGTWSALPPGLPALLQPPIDGIYAQANAFGRYGSRTDSEVERHVPSIDGADTALTTDDLPIVLPSGETALTLPLVDDTDRLRGLLIGTGGAGRSTAWYPLAAPGSRWSAVLDRLRSVDSAGSAAREGPLAHGRVRVVPIRSAGRVGFLQPTYRWRPPSIPTLNRIALLAGDTVRSIIPPTGVALRAMQLQAGGRRGRQTAAVGGRQAGGGAFRAAVAALYTAMRDALRRGDWTAFGRAFDALGRAVAGRGGRP
jgi:hypothetical protein